MRARQTSYQASLPVFKLSWPLSSLNPRRQAFSLNIQAWSPAFKSSFPASKLESAETGSDCGRSSLKGGPQTKRGAFELESRRESLHGERSNFESGRQA
jgi:hypothetical protein